MGEEAEKKKKKRKNNGHGLFMIIFFLKKDEKIQMGKSNANSNEWFGLVLSWDLNAFMQRVLRVFVVAFGGVALREIERVVVVAGSLYCVFGAYVQ